MTATRLVNLDKLKAQIEEALPISDVAENVCGVELLPSGRQKKGLCPLHGEDTPSFYVNDAKGVYHCFGCKQNGDAIQLVREVRHVEFVEALEILAEAAGIDINDFIRAPTPEEKAQDELREWCEHWLDSMGPHIGRVGPWPLALAPPKRKPSGIPAYFSDKDYLLRGEVVFPYRTPSGRLVGWKIRHADGKQFGTPADFPLAEPALFGLEIARDHVEHGRLLLVEGEFDCLALWDVGIRNCVAIGGSSFSDEQMAILDGHKIREAFFWMDGDEGGLTACQQIAKRYWQHPTVRVRVEQTWDEADPEDMVKAMGSLLPQAMMEQSRDALEWLLLLEFQRTPRRTMGEKLDFVRWIQTEYGTQLGGLRESLVLKTVAGWLEVPEADVQDFTRSEKSVLHSIDSEKVVLGRCLRDQAYYMTLRKRMVATDFFMLRNQRLWEVLSTLLIDGLEWDQPLIKQLAQGAGVDPEWVDHVIGTGEQNLVWHEDTVLDLAVRRSAQDDADRFRSQIADVSISSSQAIGKLTHAVTSKALGRTGGAFMAISDQVDSAMDLLHDRMRNPDEIHGLSFGSQFPKLSQNLQGFQPRRFVLVAATSGVGKSTISLQFAAQLAIQQSVPTDFISLEMDVEEILFKMAAHLTGVNGLKITGGTLEPSEAQRVERAMAMIRKSPLRLYAPDGMAPSEFLLYARESVMERRTEVFFIDYAQLISPDPGMENAGDYSNLGHFGRMAKMKVARGMETTVVCCAQLNREAASLERPTKENMGDSYQLVRDADVILILKENEGTTHDLWIDKNRQGPGSLLMPVEFRKEEQTFREANGGAREPDYRILS